MKPDSHGRYHGALQPPMGAVGDTGSPVSGWDPSAPNPPRPPRADPIVPDALDFLRGAWRIERRLVDYAAVGTGTFDGVARFFAARSGPPAAPDPQPAKASPPASEPVTLTYHETGELRFGGHRGPDSRTLRYRRRPDGTADVFFADGREFYHLDPRPGYWTAQHPCGQDHYVLAGRLLGDETAGSGKFEERWRVRGPGKDYEIITTLERL